MALLPNINVGSAPNDGTGSSLRDAFVIVNENFQLIEAFFPNSVVANLYANIESTGTSVFNIANVDVLNVNTISSYTTTDITATNINVDVLTANTITGFTVTGNITANVISTGTSSFNAATFTANADFTANLNVDVLTANIGNITEINTTTISSGAFNGANVAVINVNSSNVSASNTFSTNLEVYGNLSVGTGDPTGTLSTFQNDVYLQSRFYSNLVTVETDVNLEISNTRAQTLVANLTLANLTITLPNAAFGSEGLWYTFICFDEGELDNRTLTVNVQPGAGNIFISANAENTFINIGAELGTNSINLKTNGSKWFKF